MLPRSLWLTLVLSVVVGASPAAYGGYPFSAEEYEREVDEISKLAGRGLNDAANRRYAAAVANEAFTIGPELHLLGARVARADGDVALLRDRLLLAIEVGASENARGWLQQVQRDYGGVVITSKHKEMRELEAQVPPFNPDHAAAIAHAKSTLALDGHFDGLLPVGSYVLSGHLFEVESSSEVAEVVLTKRDMAR